MRLALFRREIESLATATGMGVYTPSMLGSTILRGDCRRTKENTLASAVEEGILIRLCRGAYHYPHARPDRNVMEEAAVCLCWLCHGPSRGWPPANSSESAGTRI